MSVLNGVKISQSHLFVAGELDGVVFMNCEIFYNLETSIRNLKTNVLL